MCSNALPASKSACAKTESKTTEKMDFKPTLNMPKTAMNMRAKSATTEPHLLELKGLDNGYATLQAARQGAPTFVLHDGPPYANGNLHMGHALNKVLKDMACRSRHFLGYNAQMRPGWDCHGLPIEWKVEEQYRSKGLSKEDVPVMEFRATCRAYAAKWVSTQRDEFLRLGVAADWTNPYLTMDFESEAAIAGEFLSLVGKGLVYRDMKPVMWSPVEQTALAEAEVEYCDRKTPAAWVAYHVKEGKLKGSSLLAWTTTPWTLPASVALAASPTLSYGLYRVERQTDQAWAEPGQLLALCDTRVEDVSAALRVEMTRVDDISLDDLLSSRLAHPLSSLGEPWGDLLPCVQGDHVTGDAGTGLVHTAPAHGLDDYWLGKAKGLPMPAAVDTTGCLLEAYGPLAGQAVVTQDGREGPANDAVLAALVEGGTLLGRKVMKHSYPHSWRSKAPVLFLTTPQWFMGVDRPLEGGASVRQRALQATEEVQWLPETGKRRMQAMLKDRPDWVLSRQRAWGVPLALFTRRDLDPDHPDFLLNDPKVNARILAAFKAEGSDAWYHEDAAERFLAPDHDPELYQPCMDVLDVWFDSGTSHAWALPEGSKRADLYLEGTDQHRGWFQHALLHGVVSTGQAPFEAVMTHGFTLDGKGRKMSKSVGNTVTPKQVIDRHGADVLRLWVAMADSTGDLRAGDQAFQGASDAYRKLRNTMRYLMGALGDSVEQPHAEPKDLPLLERWLLHKCATMVEAVRKSYQDYDMAHAVQAMLEFCSRDLSNVYLDVRKDILYCDAPQSTRRQASLHSLSVCLSALLECLSPVLVFLTSEARETLGLEGETLPEVQPADRDQEAYETMEMLLAMRKKVTPLLEEARKSGSVTKSERMRVGMPLALTSAQMHELRDLCLVSEFVSLTEGSTPFVEETSHQECERCRRTDEDVVHRTELLLCNRCADVVLIDKQ